MKGWRIASTGVIVATLAAAASGCASRESCTNKLLSEQPAPTRRLKGVVFHRSCGESAPPSTEVSILPISSDLPDTDGNVFVGNAKVGTGSIGGAKGPEVEVTWLGEGTLSVRFRNGTQVARSEKRVEGVDVLYGDL